MSTPHTERANAHPARLNLDRAVFLAQSLEDADKPPTEWRLLRAGPNDTLKGVFHFTRQSAKMVMELAREWGNEYSADYEHASVAWPPTEAPAAAWYDLEVRNSVDGPELWASNIRWTTRAAERIKAKEYRYISPVLHYQIAGNPDSEILEVTEFINFALTNLPATKHMDAMIAASQQHGAPPQQSAGGEKGETMKALLTALGLQPEANEQAAVQALNQLRQRADLADLIRPLIPEGADAVGTITAWRDAAGQAEALAAERDKLQAQIEQASRATEAERVEALFAKGLKEGKLTPASKEALTKALADDEGHVNPDRLEAYLNAAPRVVPGVTRAPTDKAAGSAQPTGVDAEGKTEWERLSNAAKVELRKTDPAEFDRLYTEHTAIRYGN